MNLEEALRYGQGTEVPFQCHVHDDSSASASVNTLLGVWYCYACFASGKVDGKKAPSASDLLAMLEPDTAPRIYPEQWLELFHVEQGYWHSRFTPEVITEMRLGIDPFTGDAVFPVRTPEGRLAGVGRRKMDPEAKPRYVYPRNWSASRSMFGYERLRGRPRGEDVVLVEGAADAMSLVEVGVNALACYGSGLHMPQLEHLHRYQPSRVLLGFDMDDAGERARTQTALMLTSFEVGNIQWPRKDPAECTWEQRKEAVEKAVSTMV